MLNYLLVNKKVPTYTPHPVRFIYEKSINSIFWLKFKDSNIDCTPSALNSVWEFLHKFNFCKGCRTCHSTAECIQHDDFDSLIKEFEKADKEKNRKYGNHRFFKVFEILFFMLIFQFFHCFLMLYFYSAHINRGFTVLYSRPAVRAE